MSLKFPLATALKWTLKRVCRREKKSLKQAVLRKVLGLLWTMCFSWFYLFLWQRTVQGVAESCNTQKCSTPIINILWWLIEGILLLKSMVAQSDHALVQMAGKKVSSMRTVYRRFLSLLLVLVGMFVGLFSHKKFIEIYFTLIFGTGMLNTFYFKTLGYLYFQNLFFFFFRGWECLVFFVALKSKALSFWIFWKCFYLLVCLLFFFSCFS